MYAFVNSNPIIVIKTMRNNYCGHNPEGLYFCRP